MPRRKAIKIEEPKVEVPVVSRKTQLLEKLKELEDVQRFLDTNGVDRLSKLENLIKEVKTELSKLN